MTNGVFVRWHNTSSKIVTQLTEPEIDPDYSHGLSAVPHMVSGVLSDGIISYIWWISFWINFVYYGCVLSLIASQWHMENTRFYFCDHERIKRIPKETSKTDSY